jgi:predicted nucleic acid-binding protein
MPAEPAGSLYLAEPQGNYTRYPPLVVDCSVLAALLFDEKTRETASLAMAGKELYAPYLLDHEIVSVALKKARSSSDNLVGQALKELSELRLTRTAIDPSSQFALAKRYNLSAYDAAYLQLAMDLRSPLATFDQKLGAAAKTALASL